MESNVNYNFYIKIMDKTFLKVLIFNLLQVTATAQNMTTDAIERRILDLTTTKLSWKDTVERNIFLAGKSVFCSENDSPCEPKLSDIYDISTLPEVFTAWITAYVTKSFTVIFKGCYEITNTNEFSFKRLHKVNGFKDCVLSCGLTYDHIGWINNTCFCVMDIVVSTVTTSARRISTKQCTENNTESEAGTVINLYQTLTDYVLRKDLCPAAYHLGGNFLTVNLDDCAATHSYFCENSNNELVNSSWNNAAEKCHNASSRLVQVIELLDHAKEKTGSYWIYGETIQKLKFDKDWNSMDSTRCIALQRNERRIFSFVSLRCSLKLPGLYLSQFKGNTDIFTTSSFERSDAQLNTSAKTVHYSNSIINQSSIRSTTSGRLQTTTTMVIDTTSIPPNPTIQSNDDNNGEAYGTVIGIVVFTVVVVAVTIVVVYCRKKKKNAEEMSRYYKGKPSNTNEVPPDGFQTLRYLPASISYPSGYLISDVKVNHANKNEERTNINDVHSKRIETNVTVHNESHCSSALELETPDREGFIAENNHDENMVPNIDIIVTAQCKDRSSVEDEEFIPLLKPKSRNNLFTSEDQYVSIHVPEGLMTAEISSQNEDQKSCEDQTQLMEGQTTNSDESRSTISTSADDIDESEAEISTLRGLIHCDEKDQDLTEILSATPMHGDRIDSIFFR